MKVTLPQPEHISYKIHRKQVIIQIILPVMLAALVFIGILVLIVLSTFQYGGDVSRWAAISTIWLTLPAIAAGLFILAILASLIYLIARGLQIVPTYTGRAQDIVYKVRTYILRGLDLVVKPVIAIESLISTMKAIFGRRV